ncbi:RNA annealing protein YRA1 [Intoshia linei]|uniref:RNA annealing protein YRA1 n=1 Tax=Intoshia linei TaxID=1819745 RepID=A0A177B3F0_9BILA|nr:RNA annealing protein YRA1 [Intoshia linei]
MDVSLDKYIKDNKIAKQGRNRKSNGGNKIRNRRSNNFVNKKKSFGNKIIRRNSMPIFSKPAPIRRPDSGKMIIENLDFQVTDQDIKELFSDFGRIKSYGVNYNKMGRSLGTAQIHYFNGFSAVKAKNKYNDVPLDGRKMKISIINDAIPVPAPTMRRSTNAVKRLSNGPKTSFKKSSFRKSFTKSPRNNVKKIPTVEQLDKDLEEYNKKYVALI